MRKTTTIFLMLVRLLGTVQIIVGICLWLGIARGAVAFHSALGSLFVLVLWVLAGIALFALPRRAVPLITLLLAGMVLWLGMAQVTLLPGPRHWAVQLAHLLLGVATMGLAESLGKAVRLQTARR